MTRIYFYRKSLSHR